MFKPVVKKQNGEKVLVGFVPGEATSVDDGELCDFTVETQACPEPGPEIRKFIDANAMRSFNLHKVKGGKIICRSAEELEKSEWMTWDHNYKVDAPQEEQE